MRCCLYVCVCGGVVFGFGVGWVEGCESRKILVIYWEGRNSITVEAGGGEVIYLVLFCWGVKGDLGGDH